MKFISQPVGVPKPGSGRSRHVLPVLAISVAAIIAGACAAGPPRQADPIAPAALAPSLGIDLAEYTRTPEGLYYLDLRAGDGAEAKPYSRVTVSYRLFLANGAQIDSAGGLPIRIASDPIIKGWKLGLPGMRVGGSRIIVVPPELGYGPRAVGSVPPSSVLVFRVLLMKVD